MDRSPEFRRFFDALIASTAPPPVSTPPRPHRPSVDVADVVADVLSRGSTRQLGDADRALLLDPANTAILETAIETQWRERRLAPRLLSTILLTAPRAALVPFIVLLSQHGRVVSVVDRFAALQRSYLAIIGAGVLIAREHLPSTAWERHRLRTLAKAIRSDRAALARDFDSLVVDAAGFEQTHQLLCYRCLNELESSRVGWQADLIAASALSQAPLPQELEDFEQLERSRADVVRLQERRTALQADRQAQRALRLGPLRPARGEGRLITKELARINAELGTVNRDIGQARRSAGELQKRIPARRLPLIRNFLSARALGRRSEEARERREALLALCDGAVQEHLYGAAALAEFAAFLRARGDLDTGTRYTLAVAGDDARWATYELLLAKLSRGDGNAAIELLIHAFLGRYGLINRDRDIGLGPLPYFGQTRPRHGVGAMDISGPVLSEIGPRLANRAPRRREALAPAATPAAALRRPAPPIVLLAPLQLRPPQRLRALQPALAETYQYRRTRIAQAREVTVSEDIFTKLATGLLRRPGGAALGDNDVRGLLQAEGETLPEILRAPRPQQFSVPHLLAALLFGSSEDFDPERDALLDDIESSVGRRLQAEGGDIFDRTTGRSGRSVAIVRLVNGDAATRLAVLAAVDAMLVDNEDQILQRLWLLLRLLDDGATVAHSGGNSVAVVHSYDAPALQAGAGPITVEVLYSHMKSLSLRRRTPGSEIARLDPLSGDATGLGVELGLVGWTGNAATPHVHLQIMLGSASGGALGPMFPHEFFAPTRR